MSFGAQQQGIAQDPSQLHALKYRILAVPLWVNVALGLAGACMCMPFGRYVEMPWYVSAAVGFVIGYTLPHFIYRLVMAVFCAVILCGLWFVLVHYEPREAAEIANAWARFLNSLRF